jgi:uncharacterized membrane protein YkvA (DUF1232 family)
MDWRALVVALAIVALIWCGLVVALIVAGRIWLARELAALAPNLVRLFAGLLRDSSVPLFPKIVVGGASLWLASPIDLIPDFIPVIGSLDDAVVAAVALRLVLATTDREVVREHWRGDPRTLDRLLRLVLLGRRGPPSLP